MSKLTRFVALTVLAVWGLAAMHCKLEALPGFDFLKRCCFVEETVPSPSPCENDGCGEVEDGGYRIEDRTVSAPPPTLTVAILSSTIESRLREVEPSPLDASQPPPELAKVWHFVSRAAMLPRAPSIIA